MKLLRTVAFDRSDTHVFDRAAEAGEWAIPGAFAFAGLPAEALTGKTRQAFANGFLGLASGGRATFVTVATASAADREAACSALAALLEEDFGAPSLEAARLAAETEIDDTADIAEGLSLNTVLSVHRTRDDSGAIHETFRTLAAPESRPQHARIWTVEPDPSDDP